MDQTLSHAMEYNLKLLINEHNLESIALSESSGLKNFLPSNIFTIATLSKNILGLYVLISMLVILAVTFLRISVKLQKENKYLRKNNKDLTMHQILMDTAEVILLVLDIEGNIIKINRKGCEILGWKEQELIGKNWFRIGLHIKEEKEKTYEIF